MKLSEVCVKMYRVIYYRIIFYFLEHLITQYFFENNKLQLFMWLPKKRGLLASLDSKFIKDRVICFKIESIKYLF